MYYVVGQYSGKINLFYLLYFVLASCVFLNPEFSKCYFFLNASGAGVEPLEMSLSITCPRDTISTLHIYMTAYV